MKFSDLTFQPALLRLPVAEEYVGGARNLETLRRAGWVKPLIQHKRNTTFVRAQIDNAISRAIREGWPSDSLKESE